MSHSGPFRCQCGQIHFDQYDGPSNDLLPYIDTDAVSALNESERGACKRVFKPFDQRLQGGCVESEEDDPQLIIRVPFVCPVKLRSLVVSGQGAEGTAPSRVKAFLNHEALDFADAEQMPPVQQWDLAEDPLATVEYPTQFSKFQNVSCLWLFFPDNHGADHTIVNYIGLSGVATEHKRQAVQTVYELRPAANVNDPLSEKAGPQMGL